MFFWGASQGNPTAKITPSKITNFQRDAFTGDGC